MLAFEAHKKLTREFDKQGRSMKHTVRTKTKEEKTSIKKEASAGDSDKDLRPLIQKSIEGISDYISMNGEEMKKSMQHYFQCKNGCDKCNTEIKNRHLLAKHEKEFQDDVEDLKKGLMRELTKVMDKLDLRLKADKRINQMNAEMHGQLKKKIKKIVEEQKEVGLEKGGMEKIFNDWWKAEAGAILKSIQQMDKQNPINIEATVQSTIKKVLGTDAHICLRTRSEDNTTKRKQDSRNRGDKKKPKLEKAFSVDTKSPMIEFQIKPQHFNKRESRERQNSVSEKDDNVKANNEPASEGVTIQKVKDFVKKKVKDRDM